jgi:hypothetical protein
MYIHIYSPIFPSIYLSHTTLERTHPPADEQQDRDSEWPHASSWCHWPAWRHHCHGCPVAQLRHFSSRVEAREWWRSEKVDEVLKQWAHVLGLDTGLEFRV